MSLTRELKYSNSPISQWFQANFDLTPASTKLTEQIGSLDTIKPQGPLASYPWSTVGHAVEFRLRQACGVKYTDTVAWLGRFAGTAGHLLQEAVALHWERFKSSEGPTMGWHLYMAGLAEEVLRSGSQGVFDGYRPVFEQMERSAEWRRFAEDLRSQQMGKIRQVDPEAHGCVWALPEVMPVDPNVLSDIQKVGDLAVSSDSFQEMKQGGRFIDNPLFSGAEFVGGADGDFIFGRTLYDAKTTIHPETLPASALIQIVCYVALDFYDHYRIEELGIFLPRQCALAKIALKSILADSSFDTRREMQSSLRRTITR